MVIFLNADGTAEKVTPEHVYQGSNNVVDITVIAPYSMSTAMQIGFILPNGLYWTSHAPENARYAPMEFVGPSEENDELGAWQFVLPISVTDQVGEVQVAINAIGTTGNTTSYLCRFTVEESVLPNLPATSPEPSVYDLIQQYLARLDGRTANVPNLVAAIQKASGNSLTYTDNKGVVSAPITLGFIDYNPTYVGAASVIELPVTAWQPTYSSTTITGYTVTITAAQHGQMRDGVTAADLLVNFKTGDGPYVGSAMTYDVSNSGDITITSTNPIATVAFIWNGKGLVDVTARSDIATEIERAKAAEAALQADIAVEQTRAESEEQNLQTQINEIVDSGVDKTARQQIAAETVRAESAEQNLQSQITAEVNRATTAENVLMSDINGLREDISNEAHFRGMFDSVEALRTAYPTATPNDYAYIVGGNIYIWKDNAWTDSDEPSPNTAVPASSAVPLMDGVGSAGTSSEYARGDHRHPSDTNKVNRAGDTMTGKLTVSATGSSRADVDIVTPSDNPCDLYLGANGERLFSLSARGSTDTNTFILYDVKGSDYPIHIVRSDGHIQFERSITVNNHTVRVTRNTGDTFVYTARTDTNNELRFGIGAGGENRGIYDKKLDKWLFYVDRDGHIHISAGSGGNVYVNGVVPYSSANPPTESVVVMVGTPATSGGVVSVTAGTIYNLAEFRLTNVTENFVGGIVAIGTKTSLSTVYGLVISTTQFVALCSKNVSFSVGTTSIITKTIVK